MGAAIYTVSLKDDITAKSAKASDSLKTLRKEAQFAGWVFKESQRTVGALNIRLKDAKKIFKDTGYNVSAFKASLKDAGVSALDTSLLLRKMTDQLRHQRRAALGMEGLFKRVFNPRTIWVASHAMNVLSKTYGALSVAAGAAGSVLGKGFDVGHSLMDKVVEAAEERENTILALREVFKGNPQEKDAQAQDVYQWIRKAATQTPLDTPYLIEVAKKLGEGGFHDPEEIKVLAGMVADQQSKFKGDTGMQTVEALTRLKSRAFSSARDFESFRAAGFELSDIYKELGPKLGIEDKDPLKQIARVRYKLGHGMAEAGKGKGGGRSEQGDLEAAEENGSGEGLVSSYTLLNSIIAAQEHKFGQLGSFALKNASSLTGAISNFKNAFGDLLKTADITKWDGIMKLKDIMLRVQKIMIDTNGAGGKLLEGIKSMVDGLLGGLENVKDEDISRFLTSVGDFAKEIGRTLREAWGWLDRLVHSDMSFLDAMGEALVDVGAYIGAGIWKGVKAGVAGVTEDRYKKRHGVGEGEISYQATARGMDKDALGSAFTEAYGRFKASGGKVDVPWGGDADRATFNAVWEAERTRVMQDAAQTGIDLVRGIVQGVRDEGQIRSPSKEMAEQGRWLVRGIVQGVQGEGASAVRSRGGGAGGGPSVTVPIYVYGSLDAATAGQLPALIERQLLAALERRAQE